MAEKETGMQREDNSYEKDGIQVTLLDPVAEYGMKKILRDYGLERDLQLGNSFR